MVVCFTGHRRLSPDNIAEMAQRLSDRIESLCQVGDITFRAGGAQGFDTLAALCVLVAREKYPHVKLHLLLPCKNQTEGWSDAEIEKYNYVLQNADFVRYVGEARTSHNMLKRDRELVDGADICIAYCNRTTGGTAYTISYAKSQGVRVENIYI